MSPSTTSQPPPGPGQTEPAIAAAPDGVRMQIDCSLAYALDGDCEFVFLIQAAMGTDQTLVQEELLLQPPLPYRTYTDERSGNRFLRLRAHTGVLELHYHAVVDRAADRVDLAAPEVPVHALPDEVLHFMLPTRYCESDLLGPVAPSRMAPVHQLVRLATGRDAKDVAFATIYGPANMVSMSPVLNVLEPGAARAGAIPHAPALPG